MRRVIPLVVISNSPFGRTSRVILHSGVRRHASKIYALDTVRHAGMRGALGPARHPDCPNAAIK
jgi:hypothetical protein